jgi:hypothetical protein
MASLRRVSIQQEALKSLIIQNSSSLRELSFSGSFLEGSISSIISSKRGGSSYFSGWEEEEEDEPEKSPGSGAPYLVDSDVSESSLISLAPGVEKPLRSPSEIWEAIRDGKTTVTACSECTAELHCIHDVELVICPDCWIASPIEQSVGGISLEFEETEDSGCNGVAIGVKARDVIEWLEKNS